MKGRELNYIVQEVTREEGAFNLSALEDVRRNGRQCIKWSDFPPKVPSLLNRIQYNTGPVELR